MSAPNIKILDDFATLRAELDQYGLLLQAEPNADVFCTLEWFENLALHGLKSETKNSAQCKLFLASSPDLDNLICLPLLSGKTLTGLSNYYSSLYGHLAWSTGGSSKLVTQTSQEDWDAMGRSIRENISKWPTISLDPLNPHGFFFTQMRTALVKAGYWVDSFFCFGNWYLNVADRPFATYLDALPSALLHSIERGQRKLTRQGKWRIDIQQIADSQLESAIADFVKVYEQSWKDAEPNGQFIPNLAHMAARQGWLRLGVLKLDDQAIAAQLWLVKDKKASIFKLAYVIGFERFSAGSVLTHAMMRHVIDVDKVQEIDYLTGDDAYKRDWMSRRRERWGLVAFDLRTFAGLWAACKHFAGKKLKGVRNLPALSNF